MSQEDFLLNDEEDDALLANHLEDLENGFDFVLTPHIDRRVRRLGVHHRDYTARLVQRGGGGPLMPQHRPLPHRLEDALQRAIRSQVLEDPEVQPEDHLLVNINSNRLRHSYHSTRMTAREWMANGPRVQELLQQISKMLNSNEHFQMDDTFSLHVSHIRDPGRGSGRLRKGRLAIEKLLDTKRSVVKINNKDELCCARAIVTMRALADANGDPRNPDYRNLKLGRPIQKRLAQELHRLAGVPEGPCGIEELTRFQHYLVDYRLIVLSVDHNYQIIFKGPANDKEIILIKAQNHYHGCNSLKAFMGRCFFCVECETGYDHDDIHHHPCNGKKCRACCQTNCKDYKESRGQAAQHSCPKCHRKFFGEECMGNHYHYSPIDGVKTNYDKRIKNVCSQLRKCKLCNRLLREQEIHTNKHTCGTSKCPSCREYKDLTTHRCYIQNPTKLEERRKTLQESRSNKRRADGTRVTKDHLFVYWDSETMQETGVHVPNLVCAATSNTSNMYNFEGEECITAFIEWLRELNKDYKITVIAHNSQGFDSYFILQKLYNECIMAEQVVNGAKILSLSIHNGEIVFKDSMCFFQMPLSSFPKAFGLTEQKKGFFPHFFNTEANQNYVGPLPDKEYYDPKGMSEDRAKAFHQWYDTHDPNYVFNFQEELLTYCQSDVALLKGACEVFCREFEAISGFNPLERCITIASACNLYYRTKHMPENKLASEPIVGWHGQGKPYSLASMEWLTWLSRSQSLDIQHACNGGEHVIRHRDKTYHVDGYDPHTGTAYEFHGCYWHGCPTCFPVRDKQHYKLGEQTSRDLYEETLKKEGILREQGYTVHVMWECEWRNMKKQDPELQTLVNSFGVVPRLQPRDAFFGGRTNAVKLHHVAQEGEKIHYYDFTSLYPWTNKNCLYPVGHPEILFRPTSNDIHSYFGLIQCKILPPYELYHPVLPYRSGGKLTFPLCRKCVEEQQPKPLTERNYHCDHTDEERCLTGTWPNPELQEALRQGYIIQQVYEVWHFPVNSDSMFSSYINTFLKIKQEASGWPAWTGNDPIKQQQYVQDYFIQEGIRLDIANIEKNPGKRSMAKLMLNSFWGKYGQQGNKSQVEAISSPTRLYQLLYDDTRELQTLRVVNDEMVEVVYKHVEETCPVQVNINIFMACFTTCWARLKLYQEGLSQLQPEQVLYFDTDSIIFSQLPDQPTLPLGDYLGEFTSELSPDDHIVEFASAGPKNYGYRTKDGKVECKVRGFTLNTRGQEQLNFEILRNNVIDEATTPLDDPRVEQVHNPHKICRDVNNKQIETKEETKQYRVVFDKRVVDTVSFKSYPYGYAKYTRMDQENIPTLSNL